MKPRLFIPLAVLACPAIIISLFLGWKSSWTGGHASAWMLASMILSAAFVFGLPRLKRNSPASSAVMDRLLVALVATGLLWTFFLCMFGLVDAEQKRPGIVTDVSNGIAKVTSSPSQGYSYSFPFPANGGFYHLKTGDSADVLWSKEPMLAVEKRDLLIFGGLNAVLLVFGGLFAGGRFRLKLSACHASFPNATDVVS